jgi:hypothetical protein
MPCGVIVVQAGAGRRVVPPTRAIWMLAGMTHVIRCGSGRCAAWRLRASQVPRTISRIDVFGQQLCLTGQCA